MSESMPNISGGLSDGAPEELVLLPEQPRADSGYGFKPGDAPLIAIELPKEQDAAEAKQSQDQPLPDVAFADHIRDIAEHGDVLRRSPARRPLGGHEGLVGIGALWGVAHAVNPILSFMPLIAFIAYDVRLVTRSKTLGFQKRYKPIAEQRLRRDTQEAIGHRYELYNDPAETDPPLLMWYGPLGQKKVHALQAAQALADMAKRAQEHGLEHMGVYAEVLSELGLPEEYPDVTVQNMHSFLRDRYERIGIARSAKEKQVLLASPETWRRIGQQFEARAVIENKFRPLLKLLEELQPEHPIAKAANAFDMDIEARKKDEEDPGKRAQLLQEMLIKLSTRVVTSRFDDTEVLSNRQAVNDPLNEDPYAPLRIKLSSVGKIAESGTHVERTVGDEVFDVDSVLKVLGIHETEVESLLESRSKKDKAIPKLVELLIDNALHDRADLAPGFTKRHLVDVATHNVSQWPLAQEVLNGVVIPEKDTLNTDMRKVVAMLATILVAAASAYGFEKTTLDEALNEEFIATAESLGIPYKDWLDRLHGKTTPDKGSLSFTKAKAGGDDPTIEYTVQGHGLGTAGYWARTTSHVVESTPNPQGMMDIRWIPEWGKIEGRQPLEAFHDKGQPNIAVETTVKSLDMVNSDIKIPVLEGTKPVAAQYDGKSVGLITFIDGTYGLNLQEAGNVDAPILPAGKKLTYWLESDRLTMPPHAVYVADSKGKLALDSEAIEKDWKARIPNLSTDIFTREQQIRAYISHYTYDLEPFPDGFSGDLSSWSAVVDKVDKARKVYCEPANGMNVMSNPQVVNLASGWLNDGDAMLTSREGHAWGVMARGEKSDATPGTADKETLDFLRSKPYGAKGLASDTGMLLLGGTVLACLGYASRRRFKRRLTGWAGAPEAKLQEYSVDGLSRALAVTNVLLHAPEDRGGYGLAARAIQDHDQPSPLMPPRPTTHDEVIATLRAAPVEDAKKELAPLRKLLSSHLKQTPNKSGERVLQEVRAAERIMKLLARDAKRKARLQQIERILPSKKRGTSTAQA